MGNSHSHDKSIKIPKDNIGYIRNFEKENGKRFYIYAEVRMGDLQVIEEE